MSTSAPRVALQPARQQHLLLVAARERPHGLLGVVARPDREAIAPALEGRGLRAVRMIPTAGQHGPAARRRRSPPRAGPGTRHPPCGRPAGTRRRAPIAPSGPIERRRRALDLERARSSAGRCRTRSRRPPRRPSPACRTAPRPRPVRTSSVHVVERVARDRRPVHRERGLARRAAWAGGSGRPTSAMRRPIMASIMRGRSVSFTSVEQRRVAVAQDLHAVGDLRHLVQAVGDVDDGDALVAQAPDEPEQDLRLVLRERGRGLIEDEQPGGPRERAGDLDDLALADAQGADGPARGRCRRSSWSRIFAARGRRIARQYDDSRLVGDAAQGDVLGDRQRRRVLELLEDDGDARGRAPGVASGRRGRHRRRRSHPSPPGSRRR